MNTSQLREAYKPTKEEEALNELQRKLQTESDDAMTATEAEGKTGLVSRSRPHATQPFLKCQLGIYVAEKRTVFDEELGRWATINVPLFHLMAFGHSWQRAADNARINRRAAK